MDNRPVQYTTFMENETRYNHKTRAAKLTNRLLCLGDFVFSRNTNLNTLDRLDGLTNKLDVVINCGGVFAIELG